MPPAFKSKISISAYSTFLAKSMGGSYCCAGNWARRALLTGIRRVKDSLEESRSTRESARRKGRTRTSPRTIEEGLSRVRIFYGCPPGFHSGLKLEFTSQAIGAISEQIGRAHV